MSGKRSIADLQDEAWRTAEDNGFHDPPKSRPEALALIHSEVSEALESDREPEEDDDDYATELADVVIRILDHAESEDLDLQGALYRKMAKNRGREYKHGKEY